MWPGWSCNGLSLSRLGEQRVLAVAVLVVASLLPPVAKAGEWGPWSVSTAAPVLNEHGEAKHQHSVEGPRTVNVPFLGLIRFYQLFISPMDGDRCPLYPTCSQFSIQAIQRHGPAVGWIMTADRLMHEADEARLSQKVMIGSRMRSIDTLDDNDFWWYKP